ncbi:hypothetical protein KA078_01635 [Candidatus Woesebacteria bacterium]|nr:hypothetical protein [Candidatus Woesebacteria bacterium]
MADYVGRWDCPNCKTAVLGIQNHCPNCGAECTGLYYLPAGEPKTTAAQVQEIIQSGPSWQCEHCGSTNYGNAGFCVDCGAEKGSSQSYRVIEYDTGSTPRSSAEAEDPLPSSSSAAHVPAFQSAYGTSRQSAETYSRPSASRLKTPALIAAAVLGLIAIAAILVLLFKPYDVGSTVDRFEWSRTIYVDQYRTIREEAWEVPPAGRQVASRSKEHHTVRVFDHNERKSRQVVSGSEPYDCGTVSNGNGTFSDRTCSRPTYETEYYDEPVYREDPVYATWYTYDIDRWVPSRTVDTAGQTRTNPAPHWGELLLNCSGQPVLGCEWESSRAERYFVFFTWKDGEEQKEYRMQEEREDWDAYDSGKSYTLTLNRMGILLNDPLRPEKK